MYTKKLNKNDLCNTTYMKSFLGHDPCYRGPVSVTKPTVPEHRRRYQQQMETTFSTVHAVFVNTTCPPRPPDYCPCTEYGEGINLTGQAITCEDPCCMPSYTYCC